MPSTRWLLFAVIAVYSLLWKNTVTAAEISEPLPVASNGWRPIIGTHEVKPYISNHDQKPSTATNVKQTISLTAGSHDNNNNNDKNNKLPLNQNVKGGHGNQLHISHHGSTGHHNKFLGAPTKSHHKPTAQGNLHVLGTGKPALRHPVLNKLHAHMSGNAKRTKPSKPPARPQHPAHPVREEMMAQAPSSAIGSYAYFNQGPFHSQNSPLSNKPFLPSNSHVDFSNQFAFSNINTDFGFPKHPSQNELQSNQYFFINHNDDFTRNLVPPPPFYKPQGEKETVLIKEPQKIAEQSSVHNPKFVVSKQKDDIRHIPENLVVQLPPPYNHYQQNLNKPPVDLEITKETFKEYHTTLAPISYPTSTESYITDSTKYVKPQSVVTTHHGYEVTEEKEWPPQIYHFKPLYSTITPNIPTASIPPYKVQISTGVPDINKYQYSQQIIHGHTVPQFLPTPYNPESTFPTSPTQAEVSTIYSELSQLNKKRPILPAPAPTTYNIKEVSTHFPILEMRKPVTHSSIPTNENENQEYVKEQVTSKPEVIHLEKDETTTQYTRPTQKYSYPSRGPGSQRRPGHRRRRPTKTTTTTTTEAYEPYEFQENYNYDTGNLEIHRSTEAPHRRRRPLKYRTTEAPQTEPPEYAEPVTKATTSIRYKPTRSRPQTVSEEIFVNKQHYRPIHKQHKYVQDEQETPSNSGSIQNENEQIVSNSRYEKEENYPQHYDRPAEATTDYAVQQNYNVPDTTEYIQTYTDQKYFNENIPETTEYSVKPKNKRKRIRPTSATTEILPSTNLKIPENELDYTTIPTNEEPRQESITIKEVYDFDKEKSVTAVITSSPTTTTTTTTETPSTSTKSTRIRQRPLKYEVQRPRFSVRDYRLRLNQYMSTSTEQPRTTTDIMRIRYANRLKPAATNPEAEESPESVRQRFVPKDPRYKYQSADSPEVSSTERPFKTVNTRLRPFGRYRTTTEASTTSTTSRVSIRPNIFNNLKRPSNLSLRTRIYKKRNETQSTTEAYTHEPEIEATTTNTEKTEVTIPFEPAESSIEVTTQYYKRKVDMEPQTTARPQELADPTTTESEEVENIAIPEEAETFLQLQRISDLTSSAHKQYNTPGLFKSVSPTSRRVPSYFTIATEDPILPIEAFFPNLHKNNERQM